MSSKSRSGDVELGLLNGAWEWLAEAEKSYKLWTRVVLVPTTGKGRFSVRMTASLGISGANERIVAQVVRTFPSGGKQTLAGLMLDMALQLEKMVGQWALTAIEQDEAAPKEG